MKRAADTQAKYDAACAEICANTGREFPNADYIGELLGGEIYLITANKWPFIGGTNQHLIWVDPAFANTVTEGDLRHFVAKSGIFDGDFRISRIAENDVVFWVAFIPQ